MLLTPLARENTGLYLSQQFVESVQLPFSATAIYAIIADVERYPEFLPFWVEVTTLEKNGNHTAVDQLIGLFPLQFVLESTVKFTPNVKLEISAHGGPFASLSVDWRFLSIAEQLTEVSLEVQYRLQRSLIYFPFEQVLKVTPQTLLSLFVRRIRRLLQA